MPATSSWIRAQRASIQQALRATAEARTFHGGCSLWAASSLFLRSFAPSSMADLVLRDAAAASGAAVRAASVDGAVALEEEAGVVVVEAGAAPAVAVVELVSVALVAGPAAAVAQAAHGKRWHRVQSAFSPGTSGSTAWASALEVQS